MTLDLLLARADDHQPLLPRGLSLANAPKLPLPSSRAVSTKLWDPSGNPECLESQRWGVVAPQGAEGDRLLELLEPLIQWREQLQKAPVIRYRPPALQDEMTAARWKRREFRNEAVAEPERPRYLLLLGDMDKLSLELQQVLATDAFVGRLALAKEDDYAVYVQKVLRWEQAAPPLHPRSRVLFYTARDRTRATEIAREVLVEPCLQALGKERRKDLPEVELHDFVDEGGNTTEEWLRCVANHEPSVLFSLSHGLGAAWQTPDQRKQFQGALVLPGGRLLTGGHLASGPFLPGGTWFCLACHGAGTPERSTYEPWLQQLQHVDLDAARALEKGMARGNSPPFTSALPQAALANPEGPLAFIGHVDLAWTATLSDEGNLAHSRFLGVLRALIAGRRAGNALHTLLRYFSDALNELKLFYKVEEASIAAGRKPSADPARAAQWMLCQDLANYVLLGDPAVRVPGIVTPK